MERLVKGDIAIVHFPFSNLQSIKDRPAVVLTVLPQNLYIFCQITTSPIERPIKVDLNADDFISGGLNKPSKIIPSVLFTANDSIVKRKAGSVTPVVLRAIEDAVVKLIRE